MTLVFLKNFKMYLNFKMNDTFCGMFCVYLRMSHSENIVYRVCSCLLSLIGL
jgi:hypothetical protein